MTKFEIKYTSKFKTNLKKIKHNKKLINETKDIITKLANGEILDEKFKDHALSGEYSGFRECHIRPNFLLIYKKKDEILVMVCANLGSHSELFD